MSFYKTKIVCVLYHKIFYQRLDPQSLHSYMYQPCTRTSCKRLTEFLMTSSFYLYLPHRDCIDLDSLNDVVKPSKYSIVPSTLSPLMATAQIAKMPSGDETDGRMDQPPTEEDMVLEVRVLPMAFIKPPNWADLNQYAWVMVLEV